MIGFYNYTVILTYISLLISSVGICLAATGDPFPAILCLLASGVCDMFDGKIARTRKKSTESERRFGIQIDSLCDIVCFGVLPAVLGVGLARTFTHSRLTDGAFEYVTWGLGALLVLCGLIRLAYFNVTEEMRQSAETGRRTHYAGLPITSSAVIFPFAYSVALLLPAAAGVWVYPAFMLLTAISFVAPIRIPKPHGIGLAAVGLLGLAELALLLLVRFGILS